MTATFSIIEDRDIDLSGSNARIILPEGFVLVGGESEKVVDIMRGAPEEIMVTVKSVKTGDWEIVAKAIRSVDNVGAIGGSKAIYVSVSESSAIVSDTVPLSSRQWMLPGEPGKPGRAIEPKLPPTPDEIPSSFSAPFCITFESGTELDKPQSHSILCCR